jgi:uncharacterized protein YaaQ
MKLIFAIIQDEYAAELVEAITEKGYRVTKLATTGGFLKAGNTTLIIGVEKEKVEVVVDVIKEICKTRKQIVASPSPISETTGMFVPYPVEVEVGGATVFVLDVDQFIKI